MNNLQPVHALTRDVRPITLVVSDVRLYREGITAALGQRDTIVVVGAASGVAEALRQIEPSDPDVVLFDMATRVRIPAKCPPVNGFRRPAVRGGSLPAE